MKPIALLLVLLCFIVKHSNAQDTSPYELSWKKESILMGTGAALMGLGIGSKNNMQPYTYEELFKVSSDRSSVFSFDRPATYNTSLLARNSSDVLLYTSMVLPFTTLASKRMRKESFKIGALLVETMMITDGLTMIAKHLVKRPRPFVFNPNVPVEDKLTLNARKSFFSGHASSTAALSFFTAKVFSDYHPDSKLKPLVWTAAALLPAATAYLRVKGGKHYFSDVAVGYGVGALMGFLIPHIHKTNKKKSFMMYSSGNEVGMVLKF